MLGAVQAGAVLAVLAMLGPRERGPARGCARLRAVLASLAAWTAPVRGGVWGRFVRVHGLNKENEMLRIYEVLLGLIRLLRPRVRELERRDADLARQCRRALCSAALNVAEGSYNRGKNRAARYHTALGSLRETLACFEVAAALGYLPDVDVELRGRFDHVLGTLVRLVGGH